MFPLSIQWKEMRKVSCLPGPTRHTLSHPLRIQTSNFWDERERSSWILLLVCISSFQNKYTFIQEQVLDQAHQKQRKPPLWSSIPGVACGEVDSSHCVSVIRERGRALFSSLYSPCWGNSSNMEHEGAATKCTWLTLQDEINNPAAPIYRKCLGLTKH